MELLTVYAIFALATGFCSLYELVHPVISKHTLDTGKTEYAGIMYFSMFFLSVLIAPVVFVSCINPFMGYTFRNALAEGLFPKE